MYAKAADDASMWIMYTAFAGVCAHQHRLKLPDQMGESQFTGENFSSILISF
jgi:hypothetical protein